MDLRSNLEAAIRMNIGEKLVIPVPDKRRQHSVRTNLIRLRKEFSVVSPSIAESLSIYATTIKDNENVDMDILAVVVEKVNPESMPFIIHAGGKKTVIVPKGSMTKLERMVDRAQEDGLMVEDLVNSVNELFPEEEIRKEWEKQRKLKHGIK